MECDFGLSIQGRLEDRMGLGLPAQLESDLRVLEEQGHCISVHRNSSNANQIHVIFEKYSLPNGWNKKVTRLLVNTDVSYPNSKIDMFWVEPGLAIDGGKVPQAAESVETHMGQLWQRFSWHVQKWNPAVDNIITYLGTIDERLRLLQ